ncbi:MAG: trehalose-phosphatase [bacterium]
MRTFAQHYKYLFDDWDRLEKTLRSKFLFLFLDYDGTLTPIGETPDKTVISKERRSLLNKLSKSPHCRVAIISGRSLSDIKTLIGLKNIIYAGNHGLEIKGLKIKFSSHLKSIIRHIYEDLANKLSKIKGILIEDKGLTISVHYRLVDEKDIKEFLNIFNEITNPYLACDKIKIDAGKKVYEIKPPVAWDKGKAVLWLIARQKFLSGENNIFPIYIGDDVTDEDAFLALKDKGLTVFVGERGVSKAGYYLNNTEEVIEFIRRILELKKDEICQN